MSSSTRLAPFQSTALPNGWLVFQQGSNGTRAWSLLPEDARVMHAEGEAATEHLRARAAAAGAWEKEIPATWVSLPTGLDLQVHLRHPGQPHKETLEGGLAS
ncbi:MAG: hypothetical protein EOP11_25920, partial [Proteobacteria bacterium]